MEWELNPCAGRDWTCATLYRAEMNGPALNLFDPKPLMEFGLSNMLWTFRLQKKTRIGAEKANVTSGVSSKPEGTSQMAAFKHVFTMRRK